MQRVRKILNLDAYYELRHKPCDFSIAILDSGIVKHPDLISNIIDFQDITEHQTIPYDDYGHGTHIAGIICGTGRLSGGKYEGIIPSAKIISLKILDQNGDGKIEHMIEAFKWIQDNSRRYNIRIVNISIGMEQNVSGINKERIQRAIIKLYQQDILVITAAGNNGPAPMTLSGIGESEDVIAVGCYDFGYKGRNGKSCEEYSGRGPSKYSLKKPDIVAPGTEIISCSNGFRKGRKRAYCAKSGTSMSTAIVTGAAAMLLADKHYHAGELKQRLRFAATDLHEPWNQQGWGAINIERLFSKQ